MVSRSSQSLALLTLLTCSLVACQDDSTQPGEAPHADEFGIVGGELDEFGKLTFGGVEGEGEIVPGVEKGKEDAISNPSGLPVTTDELDTSVWEVRNQWEDTSTPDARKAGMAWPAESGLSWDQKYRRWIDAMQQAPSETSSGRFTYTLLTPWGKNLPAPSLECAEAAIFLRVAFASWHHLPFFIEAADAEGRIYFGHFGMRRAEDRFARTPDFRTRYADHSAMAEQVRSGAAWPADAELVRKRIPGTSTDDQPMIGPDAQTGAYFDQVFLNKRAGHFMLTTLAYFGSIHLADTRNTFNVLPEAVATGDVLVERWQRRGIGHVYFVIRARQAGEVDGDLKMEAELASGSMPRRQPVWETPGASKRNFTKDYAGGHGYAELGGGLKRWRIARAINGRWTNVVPQSDRGAWVNSSDLNAIAARPERFNSLLVELSPAQKRDVLLDVIHSRREHLRRYPASCSARIAREGAFDNLYELMQEEFGTSRAEVDATYRTLEDYVFAELDYATSKTCCWNSSTSQMYQIAMDINLAAQQSADQCVAPIIFMNVDDEGDGYQIFSEHAAETGRADQWRRWSADESCPQADVAQDTLADPSAPPYCALPASGQAPATPPAPAAAFDLLGPDSTPVAIPDNDETGITLSVQVPAGLNPSRAKLELDIRHSWRGDLQIVMTTPAGQRLVLFENRGDSSADITQTFDLSSMLDGAVDGEWRLTIRDLAAQDVGEVRSAILLLGQ